MRVAPQRFGIQPDPVQHLESKCPFVRGIDQAMMYGRLGQYLNHLLSWVKRGKGVLKNHLGLQGVGPAVI